jgi:hypothetical protein
VPASKNLGPVFCTWDSVVAYAALVRGLQVRKSALGARFCLASRVLLRSLACGDPMGS